jgi:hypothetical protein
LGLGAAHLVDIRPQTVGSLERHYPPRILNGKSADLVQLPELVLGEFEFDRREIVLELIRAFAHRSGMCELRGRVYNGGVLKIEPGELKECRSSDQRS